MFKPKNTKKLFLLILILTACSGNGATAKSPMEAIQEVQTIASFPISELVYIGPSNMINSPTGDFTVDHYRDAEGRNFYIEPSSHIVVEIDARDLLSDSEPLSETGNSKLSQTALAQQAVQFVRSVVPGFSEIAGELDYEEGGKESVFFFNWRDTNAGAYFMPPFIQVGLMNNGTLFAFYNTIAIAKLDQ